MSSLNINNHNKVYEIGNIYANHNYSNSNCMKIGFAYYSKHSNKLWVSYPENEIIRVIDIESKKILTLIKMRADWISESKKGTLFLVDTLNNNITEIDCNNNIINNWRRNKPVSIQEHKDNNYLLITEMDPTRIYIMLRTGEIIWEYKPNNKYKVKLPGNAIFWKDKIVVSDRYGHVIYSLDYNNSISSIYGVPTKPHSKTGFLCAPHCVWPGNGDNLIICDSLNGRVIEIDSFKKIIWQYGDSENYGGEHNMLWLPRFAQAISENEVIICDSRNNRLIIVNKLNKELWEYGEKIISKSLLKLPRSIQVIQDGILIADTHHHRILQMDWRGRESWTYEEINSGYDNSYLQFPRCVQKSKYGFLIADAGNNRILHLDQDRKLIKIFDKLYYKGKVIPIIDPHDISIIAPDTYLMANTGYDTVLAFDVNSNVIWEYSDLSDPHRVFFLNKKVIIADTGNNRIVELSSLGNKIKSYNKVGEVNLDAPRFISKHRGYETIVDMSSDYRRILIKSEIGDSIQKIDRINSPIAVLNHTRWIDYKYPNIYISDTGNNRVVILECNCKLKE